MQSLPDGDEAAEFSEVLKAFYTLVYEGQDEQPPAILKIFEKEKKAPEKVKINREFKSKGHHAAHDENVPNGYNDAYDVNEDVNGTCEEIPVKVNGFPHRDSMDMRAGFPHRDSLALRHGKQYNLNGLQFSNAVNPVLIISPDELKEESDGELKEGEDDDDDRGIQNGLSEGTCTTVVTLDETHALAKQRSDLMSYKCNRNFWGIQNRVWQDNQGFHYHFSNSLIIHQVRTKEITTMKEVWKPGLNKHRF